MGELLASLLVVWIGATLFLVATLRHSRIERPLLWLGFGFHVIAAIGQVVVTEHYYGGGDMTGYYLRGLLLANLARSDLWEYLPDVLLIAAKQVPLIPVPVFGLGSSTGAMAGYAGLGLLVTADSYYAACIIFSLGALAGQLAIYNTMREVLPVEYRRRAIVAVFMIPSVVFWSSGMLKESVALFGLGLAFRGLYKLFVAPGRRMVYVPMALFGLFVIYTAKAYTLFPLLLAIGAWAYLSRVDPAAALASMLRRPFFTAFVAVAVLGGLIALGRAFPEYSPADFDEETSRLQSLYYTQGSAGSTFRFEDDTPTAERQIYLAPLGFLSAMFRPLPFEVHNATSLVEAMAMLVFNVLVLRLLLFGANRRRAAWILKRSPVLLALLVFVVIFATGVGLATPNLGSLSRYRILMMPFYALLLATLLPVRRVRPPRA